MWSLIFAVERRINEVGKIEALNENGFANLYNKNKLPNFGIFRPIISLQRA